MDFDTAAVLRRMREDLHTPANRLEGGFCMDNLQAVSQEIARLDTMEVLPIPDRVLLDTAEGVYLDRKAIDYNESRNQAQQSIGALVFTGTVGAAVPLGTVALSGALAFETTAAARISADGTCEVSVKCQTAGAAGNVAAGAINALLTNLDGVSAVTNPAPFGGGADTETDDSFRARILERIQKPITSGNKNHYIYWAKQVPGVGGAKCIPCWNGAGTVKVIVLSDQLDVPDDTILAKVADHIEENRPIGASVTVSKAVPLPVTVNVVITVAAGYSLANIRQNVETVLLEYLTGIAFDETKQLSYYKVGDLVFGVVGVADIISYTLNGGMASLTPGFEEFFQLREVTVHGGQ